MIKKILILLFIFITYGFTNNQFENIQVKNERLTKKFLKKNIPIIDIRTSPEWFQTGVVKDSILLTFFKEDGSYDVEAFMNELTKYFKKQDTFALLCRSGNRTSSVSKFLKSQGYENIINLKDGINYGIANNIPLVQPK